MTLHPTQRKLRKQRRFEQTSHRMEGSNEGSSNSGVASAAEVLARRSYNHEASAEPCHFGFRGGRPCCRAHLDISRTLKGVRSAVSKPSEQNMMPSTSEQGAEDPPDSQPVDSNARFHGLPRIPILRRMVSEPARVIDTSGAMLTSRQISLPSFRDRIWSRALSEPLGVLQQTLPFPSCRRKKSHDNDRDAPRPCHELFDDMWVDVQQELEMLEA